MKWFLRGLALGVAAAALVNKRPEPRRSSAGITPAEPRAAQPVVGPWSAEPVVVKEQRSTVRYFALPLGLAALILAIWAGAELTRSGGPVVGKSTPLLQSTNEVLSPIRTARRGRGSRGFTKRWAEVRALQSLGIRPSNTSSVCHAADRGSWSCRIDVPGVGSYHVDVSAAGRVTP